MFRHIRSKLIAAFAVPLAILVAVAGLEAVSSLRQISSVDQQTALASASVGPGGLVQDLQTERFYAVLAVVDAGGNSVSSALQGVNPEGGNLSEPASYYIAQTNAQVNSFRNTVAHAGSQTEKIYAGAIAAFNQLAKARADWASASKAVADNTTLSNYNYKTVETRTYNDYTAVINALVHATANVPLQISDPTLRTGVEALYTSLQKTEAQYLVLQDLFVASWTTGANARTEQNAVYQDWGNDQALTARLGNFDTGMYKTAVNTLQGNPVDQTFELDIELLQVQGVPSLEEDLGVFTQPAQVSNRQAGFSETTPELGDDQIAAVVNSRAKTLHNNAVEEAILFGAIGALGILLGFGLVILVSRSISRPLVSLAHQAERLATETLPATVQAILDAGTSGAEIPKAPEITVHSHDEVSDMARALDAVQQTAVELASGQAALRKSLADAFVNLGRRNQNLVTRQLEYISEIELKEADPESLEELFRLDHLATRMRRNAESLLILAGSGPARQWSASVPAMDVARAASAEVEDYKRLRLHHFDPAQITGAVTTDLVHIMAELTENALTFSPPGSPVDIYGRFLEGGYVIVIVDSGIGMSADDLEVANRRLEGEGSENDVPGRYLGHFVAGRLARRHGIAISLQASHSGGLVARVKIPAALIEDPIPDLSAMAEVRGGQPAPSVASAPVTSLDPSDAPVEASVAAPSVPAAMSESVADAGTADTATGSLVTPSADLFEEPFSSGGEGAGFVADDLSELADYGVGPSSNGNEADSLPEWAAEITEPSWQDETDDPAVAVAPADEDLEAEEDVPVYAEAQPVAEDDLVEEDLVEEDEPAEPEAVADEVTYEEEVAPVHYQQPAPPAAPVSAAPLAPEPAALHTPDLGAEAPLVVGTVPAPVAAAVAASWDPTAQAAAAAAGAGPAAQARNTADGLRKLTRRVPGASLPVEDDSLRRATPTTTGRNPLGLTGALSQYLSATGTDGRTEKEPNAR